MTHQPRSNAEMQRDIDMLKGAPMTDEMHRARTRLALDVEPLLAHIAAMGEPATEWAYELRGVVHEATERNAKYVTRANEQATPMSRQVRRTEWLPALAEGVLVEPQDTGGQP